jgi:2,3-bisphosphoglycerate-independent phosphoglycerate mutase
MPRGCENAATLDRMMRLAHEILDEHPINNKRRAEGKLPANGIWFWAEGKAVELPGFAERYGKTGAVVSAVPLCQGIGVLIGIDKILVDGATGELDTNYEGKVDAALEALKTRDFVAIHIEAPDECTHNGDTKGKIQAIEWIDGRVLRLLTTRLREAGEDFRMLVISDHLTLTSTRGHDGTPVPYIICDSRKNMETGLSYCEADAAGGRYIAAGTELISILFEASQ